MRGEEFPKQMKKYSFPLNLSLEDKCHREQVEQWKEKTLKAFKKDMRENVPVLFSIPAIVDPWPVSRLWRHHDGSLNKEYIIKEYGNDIVPVSNSETGLAERIMLRDFISSLEHSKNYLKDWHFYVSHPDRLLYSTPFLFQNDWINAFWAEKSGEERSDYKFVYLGPPGSSTPFHCDVFGSFSWSVNITGYKMWRLLSPEHSKKCYHYHIKYQHLEDIDSFDEREYPFAKEALGHLIQVYQKPGDVLFVPSGWHHQVDNLELTLSINHNWCNEFNIQFMLEKLCKEYSTVTESIKDIEVEDHSVSQQLLKAWVGMDCEDFVYLVHKGIQSLEPPNEQVKSIIADIVNRMKRELSFSHLEELMSRLFCGHDPSISFE